MPVYLFVYYERHTQGTHATKMIKSAEISNVKSEECLTINTGKTLETVYKLYKNTKK